MTLTKLSIKPQLVGNTKPYSFTADLLRATWKLDLIATPTSSSRLSVPKEMRLLNSFSSSCRAWKIKGERGYLEHTGGGAQHVC